MRTLFKNFAKQVPLKVMLLIFGLSLLFSGCKDLPSVTTDTITNIEKTTATGGGTVIDDGNSDVLDRGVCWSKSQSPTITDDKTHDGSGIGYFESNLTQLEPGTQYYVKAFATNAKGTGYGNEVTFTTEEGLIALHDPVLAIQFDDDPYNHNMHIATDGDNYYTCNGGHAASGKINKYTLSGGFVAEYPIAIDMRSIMFNKEDNYFYVCGFTDTYERNIYRITNMQTGAFTKIHTNLYDNYQSGVAMSDDGQYIFAFNSGTLKKYRLSDGALTETLTGLNYGSNSSSVVAVDPDYIYTWNSAIKTVYVYNQSATYIRSMTLPNGDYGYSLSVLEGYLFVARDGNYSVGKWYGYNIRKDVTKGAEVLIGPSIPKSSGVIDKYDTTKE